MSKIIKSGFNPLRILKDTLLIIAGILIAGLGLEGFLIPSKFIDGGVTGISLLISSQTGLPVALLIAILNIPFIFIGYGQVSKIFAIKTALAITGLALSLVLIEFPVVTTDKLLIAVFGGMCLGAGIGLAVRGGCVIDGTEVLAIFLGRKVNAKVGDIILMINIVIFSAAALILGVEQAFYSILTYIGASKTVDFIIEGLEEYTGVTIVSDHCEPIKEAITQKLGRGFTVYSGKKGFGKRGEAEHNIDILFTVITRLEVSKLRNEIHNIDEKAFVVQHSISDTIGGMIKKRPLH
ncbi:MAG: YitT family protein [bacterium]|nr:YitT family protein [bacterium]